jgi:hypothetical protein
MGSLNFLYPEVATAVKQEMLTPSKEIPGEQKTASGVNHLAWNRRLAGKTWFSAGEVF